jgi:DMSO/TMAO reductase YedYZ heme-binding membrane subunit
MRRLLSYLLGGSRVAAVAGVCCLAGFVFGVLVMPLYGNQNLPWIVARATGIGAFLALGGMCALGSMFRWPRRRRGRLHPETILRLHVTLGPTVCVLIVVHVGSLLADRYSGVRWPALVVPGAATYRPGAVTYGTIAAGLLVVVLGTATLAGRWAIRARWATVHRLAYPLFALTWLHGLFAGSDTPALKIVYVVAGAVVLLAGVSQISRQSHQARAKALG